MHSLQLKLLKASQENVNTSVHLLKRREIETESKARKDTGASSSEPQEKQQSAAAEVVAISHPPKAMSKAAYHGRRVLVDGSNALQELGHGVGRGLLDAPVSGFIGGGKHFVKGCRNIGHCEFKEAGHHFLSAVAKPVMGLTVAPAILSLSGTVACVPSIGRTIGYAIAGTYRGIQQGTKRICGYKIEKDSKFTAKLKKAKEANVFSKVGADELMSTLRSDNWDAPPGTEVVEQLSRTYSPPIQPDTSCSCRCFGMGGIGSGTAGTGFNMGPDPF